MLSVYYLSLFVPLPSKVPKFKTPFKIFIIIEYLNYQMLHCVSCSNMEDSSVIIETDNVVRPKAC